MDITPLYLLKRERRCRKDKPSKELGSLEERNAQLLELWRRSQISAYKWRYENGVQFPRWLWLRDLPQWLLTFLASEALLVVLSLFGANAFSGVDGSLTPLTFTIHVAWFHAELVLELLFVHTEFHILDGRSFPGSMDARLPGQAFALEHKYRW